jgi:hypothetical protein
VAEAPHHLQDQAGEAEDHRAQAAAAGTGNNLLIFNTY